jgi:quinol monooxygenase YgiN
MTTITTESNLITLINVFEVKPENQEKLLKILIEATEETMENVDGFISANFHVSTDKTRITNYAQWKSIEHFKKMLDDPKAREHMGKAKELSEKFDANTYNVVWQNSN